MNEGDRIIRQRKYLTEEIAGLEQRINEAQLQGVDAMALRGQLAEDIYLRQKETLALLERQQGVERDIKQLKVDQNKEFMKSFMGAGPAEMLQKLAAFRLSFDNQGHRRAPMSQGAFFGMSPEMRNNYGQLNPEYNPQMNFLRQEQSAIRQAIIAAFGSLNPRTVDNGLMDQSAALQTVLTGVKDATTKALEDVAAGIRTGGQAVVGALRDLATQVAAMVPSANHASPQLALPNNAQSGGLGGGRGFSGHGGGSSW